MKSRVLLVLPVFALMQVTAGAWSPGPLRTSIERGLPPLADAVSEKQDTDARPVELRWEELSPVVRGQTVELTTAGAKIQGQVISVRDDALLMDVRHTSDERAVRRGAASVPRGSVTEMKLIESHGSWGRNLGSTIGVMTGVIVGLWVAANVADSASVGIPVWVGIASGVTVIGYRVGKAADTRTMSIRVVSSS